jgi:hypothetical protein
MARTPESGSRRHLFTLREQIFNGAAEVPGERAHRFAREAGVLAVFDLADIGLREAGVLGNLHLRHTAQFHRLGDAIPRPRSAPPHRLDLFT